MTLSRHNLIKWVPFLTPLHHRLHAARESALRSISRIRQGVNHVRFNILWEARLAGLARRHDRSTLKRPVIHLYAVCRNESKIIPYFMDHYSEFVDEFTIYDNMSTDTTVSLLTRYKNVTVIPYDTENTLNDAVLLEIKNTAWKRSRGKADFVIVCDMDEFLYHPEMRLLLHLLQKRNYTVMKPLGVNMVSRVLPEHDGKRKITDLIRNGVDDRKNYSKTILFSPELDEIHFSTGCHKSSPTGRVKLYESDRLKLLHYKFVDRTLMLSKAREYRTRMSAINLQHGWSRHYLKTDEQTLAEFDNIVALGRPVLFSDNA